MAAGRGGAEGETDGRGKMQNLQKGAQIASPRPEEQRLKRSE